MLKINLFDENQIAPKDFDTDLISQKMATYLEQSDLTTQEKIDVNLILVDTQEMIKLNLEHRNIDSSTDVLSFFYGWEEDVLGDIFVCVDQCQIQAEERKVAVVDELNFVLVHGILHLFGFTHETDDKLKTMMNLTEEILGRAYPSYPGGYYLE